MHVKDAIAQRRSIRRYSDEPVPRETIVELLEAARRAPSGNNSQPWRFIVVEDAALRTRLAKVCHDQAWMADAPVHIAVCADLGARTAAAIQFDAETPGMDPKRAIRDTAIAVDHLMLRAVELGLGTCWIGWYTQEELKPILGVPDQVFILGVIVVGRPAEAPGPRPRRPLGELAYGEAWGRPW